EGASPESLNLAQQAEDGQKIYVPTEEEAQTGAALQDTPGGVQDTASDQAAGKVNQNTAGLEELMTLTGIGQTRADALLAYREEGCEPRARGRGRRFGLWAQGRADQRERRRDGG